MADWSTKYDKLNDYTLLVTENSSSEKLNSSITRRFSFAAGTITTTTRDWITAEDNSSYSGKNGYAANSVAVTSETQKMKDQPLPHEVALMHKKLVEMGGSPPALGDIVSGVGISKSNTNNTLVG